MTQVLDGVPPAVLSRRQALRTAAGLSAFAFGATLTETVHATANDLPLPEATDKVTPFKLNVPARALSDLKRRLAETRWPDSETDSVQGVNLMRMQSLVNYWRDTYDWRRIESQLNAWGQFRTRIDGLGIHFLHVRSRHNDAMPLLLTHGWPGSVLEFRNVIGPLVDPIRYGGSADDAFHVVIPSLPGFGFSDKPTSAGWNLPRIARAWHSLMQRLGYVRYASQGGDFGAGVATHMGAQRPQGLMGLHLNLPILFPPPVEGTPSAEEQASIAQLMKFGQELSAYAQLQTTRPQTLGYALADSPAGQAAWIYEKLLDWTDQRGGADALPMDEVLDNITLYWLTNTGASSARLYWESFAKHFGTMKVDIPVAVSVFPGEMYRPLKVWGERTYSRLAYWNEVSKGGHFAAWEQPEIFTKEIRNGLRGLRRAS